MDDDFPIARVLLLRHGSATSKAIDPDRPLTPRGQREARSAAEEIAKPVMQDSATAAGTPAMGA